MTNAIPVDTLYYTTIVSRDAKAAARQHAEFFGINEWSVVRLTPERLTKTSIRGRGPGRAANEGLFGNTPPGGEFGILVATGRHPNEGIEFQIVEPLSGISTFEHFLATRSMGVHSVFMSVVERSAFPALKSFLQSENIPIAQSFTIDGVADFYYFDTRRALGGFYIQVVVPHHADWEKAMPRDEVWDFSNELRNAVEGEAPRRTSAIVHYGVIVHDLDAHLPNFAKLFNQPIWRGMNWRTAPGSLEDTTCNGRPVVHSYFTARADVGKTRNGTSFGFEVVQPTFGPSHYKEDFLLQIGPGIHHLDLNFPVKDWAEWEGLNQWLAQDFQAPTCMSGWLRGRSALFQYQDTRKSLGYVVEIHAPRPTNTTAPRVRWTPDYWYDFGAPAVN